VALAYPSPGEVTIEHPGCGYRTQLVLLEEAPLPLPGESER
jgi:hypothetical protein